ncbi:dTDP-4-amino-4,6-dideoxygalactose transaminase [bacterium]|nr:dTDP-4-amino-4,6-dideoxygalactose transaminase [bacterium]
MNLEGLALLGGKPVRNNFIPYHKSWLEEDDLSSLLNAFRSGYIVGNGKYCKLAEKILREYLGVRFVLLTNSCTSALEMAMMIAGLKDQQEVILPSFTFSSSANTIVRNGGKPVFVEISKETFNLDHTKIEQNITDKTVGIVPVHYAGLPCEMDSIMKIAKEHKLFVIEDAAQALGSKYKGKYIGNHGDMACFSFHATKNLTCGEGGAFVTNDELIAKEAEIIREKGTNREAFLKGEIDKYTWVRTGSSFVLSDLLAAILITQLKKIDVINRRRKENAEFLSDRLHRLSDKIGLPDIATNGSTNWHIYAVRVPPEKQVFYLQALKAEGIGASAHFVPLHLSNYGKDVLGYKEGMFPIAETFANSIIRLPIYPQLGEEDLEDIAHGVEKIVEHEDDFYIWKEKSK